MDITKFTIGTPVIIKTDDDIYNSYISAITLNDENFVYFKSGSLRNTLLDKLKSNKNEIGNKLDVSGGKIKGNLTIEGQLYTEDNVITANLNSDINAPTNANLFNVPLAQLRKIGTKLSVDSDGAIKIGEGISKVLISANVTIENTHTVTMSYNLYMYKNNNVLSYSRLQIANGATATINASTMLDNCSEGDTYSIKIYKTVASAPTKLASANNRTYMTVQAINSL